MTESYLTATEQDWHFDWYLSPEEITNKNIMEPKYGGHWIDNKFIENKSHKYFITELAALVDSI